MRVGLPLTIFASIALHLGVVLGVVFAHFHWSTVPDSLPADAERSTLLLVPSPALPLPSASSPSQPMVSSVAPGLPAVPSAVPTPSSIGVPIDRAGEAKAMPPIAEANPNANVPQPKPEKILAPDPAPPVDNRAGIVFVLDVSGSMYEPYAGSTRLTFARQALAQQIRALKDGAPFAITVYAQNGHNSGPLVAASPATREAAVRFIMQDFDCGGGTNLPAGLASAQQLHAGRIVLITDGDLNIASQELLNSTNRLLGTPGHGPAISIVGICPRPTTPANQLLQRLAEQQNGSYRSANIKDMTAFLAPAAKPGATP